MTQMNRRTCLKRGLILVAALPLGGAAQEPPARAGASSGSSKLTTLRVIRLTSKTAHVQGIDTDGKRLWVTSVDRAVQKGWLQEFSLPEGHLERSVEVQDGDRYHPGGIAADEDHIWLPVAEYRRQSTAVIQQRSKPTLELESEFHVSDHIGCVAVNAGQITGGNWDSLDFYVWDHQGRLVRKTSNSSGNSYQDMKIRKDRLVASGTLSRGVAAIDWLDLSSFGLQRRVLPGNTDRGLPLTREGMTTFGNEIWLLPEDGDSRLFVLEDRDAAAN